MKSETVKCVIVGDGAVGKTSLLWTHINGEFPTEYAPTVYDHETATVMVKGKIVYLTLYDTGAGEDYDRLRPLSYPDTDVFLVCFSVVSLSSFINVKNHWKPELDFHIPRIPILLVGTKSDLREKPEHSADQVSNENVLQMSEDIGAVRYMECSALRVQGVREVFDEAVRVGLDGKKAKHQYYGGGRKKKKCALF